jgi:hypothetical protein
MYSIYFMKIETHAKLSFHCSDFWPPILPASSTYTKDGRSDASILGTLGILQINLISPPHLILQRHAKIKNSG